MNNLNKGIFTLHRITGTIIALFFAMWFITGLVLLYHGYPGLETEQVNEHKEVLPDSLPALQEILARAPEGMVPTKLSLRQFQGQTLFKLGNKDTTLTVCADTLQSIKPIDWQTIEAVAKRWVNAEPSSVDTLHERVQWILYSRYERALPIYKLTYDDKEKHELFISKKDAVVQQFTNRKGRIWAWVGSIPHKFYIPWIRKDVDRWETFLTIGGIFCFIAAFTGLYAGVYILVQHRKVRKKWETPYKKRWYKWHHVAGLIFGIFMIAWGISGAMSMQRIPTWLVPMKGDYFFSTSTMWGKKSVPLSHYQLDYRQLKIAFPQLKDVEWTHFGEIPVYLISEGSNTRYIDASTTELKELFIPQETIVEGVKRINGEDADFKLELMTDYDNYYLSRWSTLDLPVYKVTVNDADKQVYYINPKTGYVRYLTKNKMVKKWVFNGIHYLNIKWLIERPVLWTICIWTLCLGGAVVSLSGVVLGIRYLKRQFKRLRK